MKQRNHNQKGQYIKYYLYVKIGFSDKRFKSWKNAKINKMA